MNPSWCSPKWIALLGRLAEPLRSLLIVHRKTLAQQVALADFVLRARKSLIGGLAVPLLRLCEILWDTQAVLVHEGEAGFSRREPLLS